MIKKLLINSRTNPATGQKEILESREIYADDLVAWEIVDSPPELTYEPGKAKKYSYDDTGNLIVITTDAPHTEQEALQEQLNALDATLQELLIEIIPNLIMTGGGDI